MLDKLCRDNPATIITQNNNPLELQHGASA